MEKDLIFEIGSEELPAGAVPRAMGAMEEDLRKRLDEAGLTYSGTRRLGTPRRLAVIVEGLTDRQSDRTEEVRGPKKEAAYGPDGAPTRALEGFARAQGVAVEDIKTIETEKGEYVCALKETRGRDTLEILPGILAGVAGGDYFTKSMRWGAHDVTYARPVHWILAVYGGEPVPFEFGHIASGSVTYGHRFLAGAAPVEVADARTYVEGLKARNVIPDPEERRRIIIEGLEGEAQRAGGAVVADEGLVEEVTYLVEYPVVVSGSFEAEFLELPREVVINAMREHQRYFSVADGRGRLLPVFITVSNTLAKDMDVVARGNERVLRARLNDAKFYYDQDILVPLTKRAGELKGVVFQARLGTSFEKVERFTRLALFMGWKTGFSRPLNDDEGEAPEDFLSEGFNPARYDPGEIDPGLYAKYVLGRSSVLAKADLVTGMVGEFPKLQGVMGSVYAARGGEVPEVAVAIYEHYLPTGAAGELPASVPGAIVSIADKLDTICGCFAVGQRPTGAADPYALRRSALGIISIMLDKKFSVPIDVLIDKSIEILGEKLTGDPVEVKDAIIGFFKERLRNMLLSEGLAYDSIDAVLSAPWFDIPDAVSRVRAIEGFKGHPDCGSLVVAFKRVSNILKGVELDRNEPDPALLEDDHERALWQAASGLAPAIERYSGAGDYERLFAELASIKATIDTFFDEVMVMVEDEKTRKNRLALLGYVRGLYFRTADLSKLAF